MLATHVTSGTCLLEPKNGIFPVWPLFSNLRFRALIWRRAIDPISVARRVSGAEDHKNTIIVLIKIQKCMVVTIYVRNILTTDPYRKDGIFSLQAAPQPTGNTTWNCDRGRGESLHRHSIVINDHTVGQSFLRPTGIRAEHRQ